MFAGKARRLPESGAPLLGSLLTLPANIRLSWKSLPGSNTLAYYENPLITAVKSFIGLVPKQFDSRNYVTKLSRFFCAGNSFIGMGKDVI